MAGTALAWSSGPSLASECAPDANSYAWKITLPSGEPNYKVDWSFASNFAGATLVDFLTAGDHEFTTARGGTTLYVRWHDDTKWTDSAIANAELCAPPPNPDIQITKSNDAEGTVAPGAEVTYTYKVKNTGNVGLEDIVVKDQIEGSDNVACEPVEYQSSDGNGDKILDPGETWTFTCTTELQGTTTNQACVSADIVDEDAQPVKDCDDNTVEVSATPEQTVEAGTGTPGASLPNTSLDGNGPSPLPTILFSLVLLASLGTLAYTNVKVAANRKR
jgi:uncharacterized repeat protein (TIGR01451 family)